MTFDNQVTRLHVEVMKQYPSALLLQMNGELIKKFDGEILPYCAGVVLHYATDTEPSTTIVARYGDAGEVIIETVDAQFQECRPMTHRHMISLTRAVATAISVSQELGINDVFGDGKFCVKHDIGNQADCPYYYFAGYPVKTTN